MRVLGLIWYIFELGTLYMGKSNFVQGPELLGLYRTRVILPSSNSVL